jgi:hypothetical protein
LSILVTGANVHGSKGLEPVLTAIAVKRKRPRHRRSQHLCADAGYRGAPCLHAIDKHGYIAHVVIDARRLTANGATPARRPGAGW